MIVPSRAAPVPAPPSREAAGIVREAGFEDKRFDAPEAPGLGVALRGLPVICGDDRVPALAGPPYELLRRGPLLGGETA
ncbi:chromate resistance protein [Nonomuraea zeae]|uniref:Chromate resistance protein n=1 Tax=Nonomuraea zeae TaxID=1642303 RepID=A0A5S4GWX4_9ACTN|nr:chromate resistance protein [Nonomuraea zeae]TMR37478.1 chromate resistance protein [Nonomuraea zeae]